MHFPALIPVLALLVTGHGIILGRRYQKISFGCLNQDYGTIGIEAVFPR